MSGFLASIAGATYAPPVPLASVAFDGVDDYYSATGITSTATDGSYATVAITFYYDGSNGDFEGMLNLRLGTNDANWGLVIGLAGGTKVRLIRVKNIGSDGGALYLDSVGDTVLTTNGWNQVVFWHKGDSASVSNSRCWVNGVQQTLFADGTITNTSSPYNWGHTNGQVWIGRHTTDMIGGTQPYFKGRYSQIYIHNGQTTAPSISSFWNTTTNLPKDLGTNGTATGLAQPLIYHYGNTSTFPTNNGTGFSSYTLTQSGGVTGAAGPTYAGPEWNLYTASTSETQENGVFDGQLAVMGHNSDGTIRAAYTGNSTSSTQGFIKPILFNPSTNAITFGTKVNCMQYTSTAIYGLKTVSETEYNIGTADATNFGVTYLPNNNSPGSLVSIYPFSMDSAGAVTVGTSVVLPYSNVGTADRPTDIAYDGTYSGTPRYTLVSRYDTGSNNQIAISRSSNTLSITRSFNGTGGIGNRATISGSFAGLNEASSLMSNGNGGEIYATTWGSTTRQSAANTSLGISGKVDLVLITSGSSAKYMAYGANSAGTAMTSRIVNVTYSASAAPTISLGASLYQENASLRTIEFCRLVKSWNSNEAFLFYTSSNTLYVKKATISTDAITWGSETTIGSITGNYFDIMPAYVDATKKYMMGIIYNAGNTTAFALKNNA